MQFIPTVFVIQIPDYHQLGESCGVAGRAGGDVKPLEIATESSRAINCGDCDVSRISHPNHEELLPEQLEIG